jgi:hypothetical protein
MMIMNQGTTGWSEISSVFLLFFIVIRGSRVGRIPVRGKRRAVISLPHHILRNVPS